MPTTVTTPTKPITAAPTVTPPATPKLTPEEQLHVDARDRRVAAVKSAIEAAKVIRDEKEKAGVTESEGAKIDRLAKEKKDLDEASKLLIIENFTIDSTNLDLQAIYKKVTEIIAYINKSAPAPKEALLGGVKTSNPVTPTK